MNAYCVSAEKQLLLEENIQWNKIGISSKPDPYDYLMNDIKYWKKAGIKTPKEAQKWQSIGVITHYKLKPWIIDGKPNLNKAKLWKSEGFDLNKRYAAYYVEKGYKSPQKAMVQKQWDDMQLGYGQEKWKKTGRSPAQAKNWIDAGMVDGYRWINSDITTIKEALKWQKLGVHGGLILGLQKQGFKTSEQLAKVCPLIIDEVSFVLINPYKVKNKCVATCLKIKQVLSQNKVFAYVGGTRAVSAKSPTKMTDDFISGNQACGVYKIIDSERFILLSGKSITGSKLKRISTL